MEQEQIELRRREWADYEKRSVEINDEHLDYFVLPESFVEEHDAPEDFIVHMHNGRREGDLLAICETWPEDFRPYALIHERFHHFTYANESNPCVLALKDELALVPAVIEVDYIKFRHKFFGNLVEWGKRVGRPEEEVTEFQESLEHLEFNYL
ncbi:MAG: hypothetical protein ACE5FT_04760 [Candidatus Nanoarchaeia archaeon]